MTNGFSAHLGAWARKAQVTIFIILAIVLVIGIILAFMLLSKPKVEKPSAIENPRTFIKSCVRDAVEASVMKISDNGGRANPAQYIQYQDEKYNYLCYQGDYYLACYNTHPMLEQIIEKEIYDDTEAEVKECFKEMVDDFEAKGNSLKEGDLKYSVDLVPGAVRIKLDKRVDINNGESSQTFEDFDTEFTSSIYKLVRIAREIVNSESQYCNVEYNGYMILYPQYEIKRTDYMDSKLYWIRDRESDEVFRFAVRSCAFAPGI